MRRKVIKQGHNTLTVTLPRKWCDTQNLEGGDELDIEEDGNTLQFSIKPKKSRTSVKIDISNLDRASIMYSIRNAYREGYDQIEITFENTSTIHHRTLVEGSVLAAIHYEVRNLVGFEVIDQLKNSCILKDISAPTSEEFDTVLRRIFLLLITGAEELVEGMKNKDKATVNSTLEKHDTITKFASYCLRMINKGIKIKYKHTELVYHIIASLDKLADVLKYTARAYDKFGNGLGKQAETIALKIVHSLRFYYELFYQCKSAKVHELTKNRDEVIRAVSNDYQNLKKEEILIITNLEQILEIIADLIVARMGLS